MTFAFKMARYKLKKKNPTIKEQNKLDKILPDKASWERVLHLQSTETQDRANHSLKIEARNTLCHLSVSVHLV